MGKFTLIALPYAQDALEPVISKETIAFHHGKHLAGYVNNLNAMLDGSPLAGLPLEEIVLTIWQLCGKLLIGRLLKSVTSGK